MKYFLRKCECKMDFRPKSGSPFFIEIRWSVIGGSIPGGYVPFFAGMTMPLVETVMAPRDSA